jgi:predicted pyridoxine 5'-phosphate oxidase superfamily flavin-nucleotide-binding protein
MPIRSLDELRALYAAPTERARRKELAALDAHCRAFIALSPFVVLSTGDAQHRLDASPRGGDPGFVQVAADGALLLPDAPGNNRLDSL